MKPFIRPIWALLALAAALTFTAAGAAANTAPPTISYKLTGKYVATEHGWHRGPVTVVFSCKAPAGSSVSKCPAPVKLSSNGVHAAFTATATAADSATAQVIVPAIQIDASVPKVWIIGPKRGQIYKVASPPLGCRARDPFSGIASCTLDVSRVATAGGFKVVIKAYARSVAGASASATVSFSVQPKKAAPAPVRNTSPARTPFIAGHTPVHGNTYKLALGRSYQLVEISRSRPCYVYAAPQQQQPSGGCADFTRHGSVRGVPRWTFKVALPKALSDFSDWQIGVLAGPVLHVLTIQTR